jgi:molecular chaperone DnaK
MWSWLKFWQRGKQVDLPPAGEVARRAPTSTAIRMPPPGTKAGVPRYSFTAFDNSPPRRGEYHRSGAAFSTGTGQEPILGIDLGTTHAVAAVVQDRLVTLLANQEGELLTPCVVARSSGEGEWLVGEPARRQALTNPQGTVRSFKRLLGVSNPIAVGERHCPPQQLAGLVLRKLREAAEARLGQRVRRAVIPVPVGATAEVRQAIVEAAELAGLQTEWELTDPQTNKSRRLPMRLLAKPTAAALGYGLTTAYTHDRRVAVLHLGGGSFDVSLLQIGDGVFHVHAVGGAVDLGGDSLDELLARELGEESLGQRKASPATDSSWQRLLAAVEQARLDLSSRDRVEIVLPCFALGGSKSITLHRTLTRQRLEQVARPLVERCREILTRVVADARVRPSESIAEVALTGGLMRMPLFRALVGELFGASVPCRVLQPEIVAVGAAIQGHQLQLGSRSDVLLIDVLSLSLGVETTDGTIRRLIERGTNIPTSRSQKLDLPIHPSTSGEKGEAGGEVRLRFFQGESDRPAGNSFLGEVVLAGVRAGPSGQASVEVSCEVDVSGLVEVTLMDTLSGRERTTPLRIAPGLGPAEIARLVRETEQERLFRAWNFGAG